MTRGAGSGMRAAQELEAFRRRYGADNTEKMRQVRRTVSIDADDFDDESHISSHVEKNSSAAETISEAGGRVTPPAPPKRPLSENFGRMDPVSYTHLDVYKRQAGGHTASARRLRSPPRHLEKPRSPEYR